MDQFIAKLTNAHLAVPLMFVMIFLWLNGSTLWGPYWETNTALAYIIMFGFVVGVGMSQKNSLMWLTHLRLSDGLRNFWVGFFLMFAGLVMLNHFVFGDALGNATISKAAVYPSIAITAFYVAPVEETIFRGVLKEYIRDWRLYGIPLAIVITSILFGFTHYAVYGGQMMSLWLAMLMGGVFFLFTELRFGGTSGKLGVPGSIGAHTCYNLFVLGILSGGIVST